MPEQVGVIVGREYERDSREVARRLGPCFEVVFHVRGDTSGPGSTPLSEIAKRRWVILAIPVQEYPIVVPALVRDMEAERILIALNWEPYALVSLNRHAGDQPWIVLCPRHPAQPRWNRPYRGSNHENMELTLTCIGHSLPSTEEYQLLCERLGKQTPGIAIKIVPAPDDE